MFTEDNTSEDRRLALKCDRSRRHPVLVNSCRCSNCVIGKRRYLMHINVNFRLPGP
jgi:hypothetical protein